MVHMKFGGGDVIMAETDTPYHHGERFVQQHEGVQEISNSVSKFIRDYLTQQHKAFFEDLFLLHVGTRMPNGQVWATTLFGAPGFIKATDDHQLRINLRQFHKDPVRFSKGIPFGSVGLMLHNRRRNKLNGTVDSSEDGQLVVRVDQAIGNCPKYIQIRHLQSFERQSPTLDGYPDVREGGPQLGEEEKAFIQRGDTLFLATSFKSEDGSQTKHGCDCNHRGGSPGFVQVADDHTLLIPDYFGNNMFQSLGNIVTNPAAGIQFLDFTTGDSLQLTGHAEIVFEDNLLPGAQRIIRFVIDRWVHVKGALPFTTVGPTELSPYNPELQPGSSSVTLKCADRRNETADIMTFFFSLPPSSGQKPFCEAGQFASFDFSFPNGKKLNRTWTISSPPEEIARTGQFSISVKKAGLVSSWIHENLVPGKEIQFRGVDGDFTLDKAVSRIPPAGVLLIAAGIGVTPMRVMFAECLKRGYPVVFLYSFRTCEDGAFLTEFYNAAKGRKAVKLVVVLTGASCSQSLPATEVFHGRLDANIIKQACPDCDLREVFQCGPLPMMRSTSAALEGLGVPPIQIHQEAFNF